MKFTAALRMEIRRTGDITENSEKIGINARIKVLKNKMAAPFQETTIDLIYGKGFVKMSDLVNAVLASGVAEMSGAWVKYEGESYQGKKGFMKFLEENEEECERIKRKVLGEEESSEIPNTTG